jgi:hypothetical protein
MHTEFISFQVPKSSAFEIYRSLLSHYILECAVRRERGLETPSYPPLLEQLEGTLGLTEERVHREFHETQDELWEYSWTSYTEEWAWYRARRAVMKTLGSKAKQLPEQELNALIEQTYQEKFDLYIAEIDMQDSEKITYKKTRKNTTSLRRNPPSREK